MGTESKSNGEKRAPARFLSVIVLCVACIALNIVGARIAIALNLPVFLDSTGTMLAGILGGYVPAVVVGYLTNLINGIADSTAMYYGIINVLIALAAAFFAKRGWFKELPLILLSIPIFTLIGGGLGSILTYLLYGAGFGDGISAQFAHQLYDNGIFDVFGAQLCADLFVDFIDKSLTVLFVAIVYHLLSEEFLAKLDFRPWRQAPMTQEELDETMSAKSRVASLQTKVIVAIVVLMALVAVATTAISFVLFYRSMVAAQSENAASIASLLEQAIDPSRIDQYMTEGEVALGYPEADKRLAKTRDLFPGVESVRVVQIREDGCHIVFDSGTQDTQGSNPGDVIPLSPEIKQHASTLLAGGEIEPVMSRDSDKWLLTLYKPLKNDAHSTVAYIVVDISMEQLLSDENLFLTNVIALFAAFLVLVCAVILWLARYSIVLPVNSIARATSDFTLDDGKGRTMSSARIDALDIRTGDEIENVYGAINHMSQEAVRYTTDAQEKSEVIERMQDNLIMIMADLVESRDKYTGDHVRNTAAYTRIAMNQMRREGIYPEVLTNEFISNVNKSAPLHDVGKIAVSDIILNKPGRFTDEEFEIMKKHTIAGKDILERAKGAVSEPSYLDEAQRLAAYHHEKWNGSGYPYGLSGEDIPLSARIMAVADVFDALVSKRSYKEGFPIDKALDIIEDGIGTHFDPQVARAFLHAQDKARAVAESNNEEKRAKEGQAAAALEETAEQVDMSQTDAGEAETADRDDGKPAASGEGSS